MKQKIAIVGAGLSGLVTAKTLLDYGHDVTVFEKEAEIGGVWAPSRRYPGLTTQNTRDSYAFSDFRMPKQYPEFPTGLQMLAYLKSYAQHFDLMPCIRLQHRITTATPEEGGGWLLNGEHNALPFSEYFDYLVVCNGTFSEPFIPQAEGMEDFVTAGGQILHTSKVQSADFRDKKVTVVGFGKSACDVAASIAGQAREMHLVFREAKWKVPKRILGINYKYLLLTRFGEALTKLRYRNRLENFIHFLRLPQLILGRMQGVFARQQGLKAANLVPATSIMDLLYGELSVETDGFYQMVRDGKIKAVPGEIRSYHPGGFLLRNGERLEADIVVYGTGFSQTLPFLSKEIRKKITDADGNYLLYRNILPTQVMGLAFVGYNTSFYCNLTSEMAALWLAEHLRGNIALPSPAAMEAQILDNLNWRKQFRPNAMFRNAGVYPFHLTYLDWLMRDMKSGLSLSALLAEWLVVMDPSHYEPVKQKIMKRSGVARRNRKNVEATTVV
ncbi:MAG: NAD(P)/FAD-dependent oxidoreductase [Haliscomenobacteraceae bacterium CHB4]|nr:NAD(P)/FAD-dependent oxidoreductase [Haliscomenobacteraceae bacterium CHB4]